MHTDAVNSSTQNLAGFDQAMVRLERIAGIAILVALVTLAIAFWINSPFVAILSGSCYIVSFQANRLQNENRHKKEKAELQLAMHDLLEVVLASEDGPLRRAARDFLRRFHM